MMAVSPPKTRKTVEKAMSAKVIAPPIPVSK